MITLKKIVYVVGLTIAISTFSLFLYSFMPHIIYNNSWDNQRYNQEFDLSEDEILEKFKAHPVYAAFYEKYPDAVEEFKPRKDHAELEVGIANYDTNSYLTVQFRMSPYDKLVNLHSYCDSDLQQSEIKRQRQAQGMFVMDFIEMSNCVK